jgi:hypothetical protein
LAGRDSETGPGLYGAPALDFGREMMGEIEKSQLGVLAEEINAEHRAFVGTFRKTVEHGIRAGELLAAAKAECTHGTWLPWLEENFEGAPRTAQEYMRLSNHRDEIRANTRDSAHLSIGGALKEIAAPREAAEETPLEYHQRKAIEHLDNARQACFAIAQTLATVHRGRGHVVLGYDDFPSYIKGAFADQWVARLADDLVDERGEPHGVFQMAAILDEKWPEAMVEYMLAQLPDEEQRRLRAEWAEEDAGGTE